MASIDKIGMVVAMGIVVIFVGIAFSMASLENIPKDASSLEKAIFDDIKILEKSIITAEQDILNPKSPSYGEDPFGDIAAKVRAANPSIDEIKEKQKLEEKIIQEHRVAEEQEFKDSFEDYRDTSSQGDVGPQIILVRIPLGTAVQGCEQVNECYTPANIRINVGDVVIWTNDDTAAHTVSGGNPGDGPSNIFESGLMMSGSTFAVPFNNSGMYDYFCMVHPWMDGTIKVAS